MMYTSRVSLPSGLSCGFGVRSRSVGGLMSGVDDVWCGFGSRRCVVWPRVKDVPSSPPRGEKSKT